MTNKMNNALNEQVKQELFAGYLYLAMSADFTNKGLAGFANWMRIQAQEELTHAMKIYDYLQERGGKVTLMQLEAPKGEWSSPLEAFNDALKHEQKVTGLINELVDLAISEKDHASNNFLQWFVAEQVEEEASVEEVLQHLKLAGEAGPGLFMMDRELGSRVFTPPAAE